MKNLRKVLMVGGFLFAIGALLFPNNMKVAKEDMHERTKIIRRAETTCNHEGGEYWDGTWQCCGTKADFSVTAEGWNSDMWHINMDGSNSWAVEVNFKNERISTSDGNAHNFVAEVFGYVDGAARWDLGGWTFRSDWCGWGPWTDGGKTTYDDFDLKWDDFVGGTTDMDVDMQVKFNANIGKLSIRLQYHSNASSFASINDMKMIYYARDISHRGGMRFSFGADHAKLTVNKIKVLNDSELKVAQFAEDWMYMRRNGGNSICGYLTGTNYSTLKDLVDCYNAMTSEEQTRAYSLLWNEPCDLSTTIAYIESYLAIKGAPAQSSLANGNLATSTSSSSTYLVIFISLIGILATAGYYFLNKKRALK